MTGATNKKRFVFDKCRGGTRLPMNEYIAKAVAREKYSRKEIIRIVNDRYGHLINKKDELQS